MTRTALFSALGLFAALAASGPAAAASFGDLSAGPPPSYPTTPPPSYSTHPEGAAPQVIWPQTLPPPPAPPGDASLEPQANLPGSLVRRWQFGEVNSTTDPFNPWGLSTPYMYVPWSTPLSGWTNAQTWNWWRERSGAMPRNW